MRSGGCRTSPPGSPVHPGSEESGMLPQPRSQENPPPAHFLGVGVGVGTSQGAATWSNWSGKPGSLTPVCEEANGACLPPSHLRASHLPPPTERDTVTRGNRTHAAPWGPSQSPPFTHRLQRWDPTLFPTARPAAAPFETPGARTAPQIKPKPHSLKPTLCRPVPSAQSPRQLWGSLPLVVSPCLSQGEHPFARHSHPHASLGEAPSPTF